VVCILEFSEFVQLVQREISFCSSWGFLALLSMVCDVLGPFIACSTGSTKLISNLLS
jgi:hypothetical protein